MSSSPDATVFWGYDLGDMYDHKTWESLFPSWYDDEDEEPEEMWWDVAAARLGWVESKESSNWETRRTLLVSLGVELQSHGPEGGDRYWRVSVKASEQWFSSWGTWPVKPLVVDPQWSAQMARFVELLELPVSGEPGRLVTVNYG